MKVADEGNRRRLPLLAKVADEGGCSEKKTEFAVSETKADRTD